MIRYIYGHIACMVPRNNYKSFIKRKSQLTLHQGTSFPLDHVEDCMGSSKYFGSVNEKFKNRSPP